MSSKEIMASSSFLIESSVKRLRERRIEPKLYAWNEGHLSDYIAKHSLYKLDQKLGEDRNVYILLRSLTKPLGWNKIRAEIMYKILFLILV